MAHFFMCTDRSMDDYNEGWDVHLYTSPSLINNIEVQIWWTCRHKMYIFSYLMFDDFKIYTFNL